MQLDSNLLGNKRNRNKWEIVRKSIIYLMLTLIALYMMLPFYWSVLTSFRNVLEAQTLPVKLYPTGITTENFSYFFEKVEIFTYFGNTLFVIIMVMFFQLLFCCLGGYSLARLHYSGKNALLKFMYASMMIPGVICLVPQYLLVLNMNLTETLWGIIIPSMYSIYGVLFMRSFFLSTPKEIAEAARIDGAGEFRIFSQLYLPMVMPGIMTLALFTFNANWNSYLWPSLIVQNNEDKWVMAVAIKQFESLYNSINPAAVIAGALIVMLPSMLIFLLGQKYFLENLTFSGIK